MKRALAVILVLTLSLTSCSTFTEQKALSDAVSAPDADSRYLADNPSLSLSAKHAVLISESGHILYGKSENEPAPMASCTKVMTALLALEYLETVGLSHTTRISQNAVGIEGSSVYLEEGEEVALLDLVYALLLASANDSAVAIAEAVSGSLDAFVLLMNKKAKVLALEDTHFENPHGLSAKEHYTTAYSLARLLYFAMQNELFARITQTRRYVMKSETKTRYLENHNRLLSRYSHTRGGKTGFTKEAGRCLVSVAEQNGLRLYAVTLWAPDDWNDHATLYEYGFSHWQAVSLDEVRHEIPVIASQAKTLTVKSEKTALALPIGCAELDVITELPRFVYAPIAKGDKVGRLIFSLSGKTVAVLPLVATEKVAAENKKTLLEKLFS